VPAAGTAPPTQLVGAETETSRIGHPQIGMLQPRAGAARHAGTERHIDHNVPIDEKFLIKV
jgi:hypothetical protein